MQQNKPSLDEEARGGLEWSLLSTHTPQSARVTARITVSAIRAVRGLQKIRHGINQCQVIPVVLLSKYAVCLRFSLE